MGLEFPNLPYYIEGDLKITQSMAILRYLGRKHKLYGNNDKETAKIDMLIDFASDLRVGLGKLAYNPDFVSFVPRFILSVVDRPFYRFCQSYQFCRCF